MAENDIKFVQENASGGFEEKTLPTDAAAFKIAIGQDQVDNIADADKPVSTAQQAAIQLQTRNAGWQFQHTLSSADWRKAAKFTYTITTAPTFTVNVTGGATHVKMLRWDGTWSAVKAVSGNTSVSAADWGTAPASPYNTRIPKFGAIVPCDSGGTVTGDLSYLNVVSQNLTTLDVSGLTALTFLNCDNNNLTTLDVSGLTALIDLSCDNNNLTTLDVSGLTALIDLSCDNNNLTNLDVSGLTALAFLDCNNNPNCKGILDLRDFGLFNATGSCYANNCAFDTLYLPARQISGTYATVTVQNNNISQVVGDGFEGFGSFTTSSYYALGLNNCQMTTDAVQAMLQSFGNSLTSDFINLQGNPCDKNDGATTPEAMTDGDTYTESDVQTLLDAKGYSLILSDATLAPA